MMTDRALADRAVALILTALEDRRGFDGWWHDIDEEIQDEIKDDLGQQIAELLWLERRDKGPVVDVALADQDDSPE
jgi:hypothetical protein